MSQVAKNLENRYNAPVTGGIRFEPVHHVSGFTFPLMPVVLSAPAPEIRLFRWGLIPSWTSGTEQAGKIRSMTLNARSESAFEKPSFRKPILSRRCLVPADGFFEWQEKDNRKIPWFIRVKNQELFSFAGLWDAWEDSPGQTVYTYSILTTEANPMMAEIHNTKKRMPLILSPEDESRWIDRNTAAEEIRKLMMPFPMEEMESWTIGRLITTRGANTNTPEVKRHCPAEPSLPPSTLF